jgi:hypothetical protein
MKSLTLLEYDSLQLVDAFPCPTNLPFRPLCPEAHRDRMDEMVERGLVVPVACQYGHPDCYDAEILPAGRTAMECYATLTHGE